MREQRSGVTSGRRNRKQQHELNLMQWPAAQSSLPEMDKARKERERRIEFAGVPANSIQRCCNKPFRYAHSLVNSTQTCECRHKGLSSVEECQRRREVESRSVASLSSVEECQRRSVRQGHQKEGKRRAV